MYDFVEGTICLQLPETDEDFYQSAVGFGTFQQLLTDFPAAKLHETIPNFHNTPDRYRALLETLERDPCTGQRRFSLKLNLRWPGRQKCRPFRTR